MPEGLFEFHEQRIIFIRIDSLGIKVSFSFDVKIYIVALELCKTSLELIANMSFFFIFIRYSSAKCLIWDLHH